MKEKGQDASENYQSWDEIFSSDEERIKQFNDLIDEFKNEYVLNNTFIGMERKEEDGIQKTIINKTHGESIEIATLENGNLELTFLDQGNKHTNTIVPDVGIRDFRWTYGSIKYLRKGLDIYRLNAKEFSFKAGHLSYYARGKPATKDSENIMKFNGHTPSRIGFKIYPAEILKDASIFLSQKGI